MATKKMTIKEFRELGFIQEINRRFLHPMGMAMEVVIDDDGTEHLGGVWDYRDDPEGIHFGDYMLSPNKARTINKMLEEKKEVREKKFGFHIQPLPENEPDTATPTEKVDGQ